MPRRSKLSHEAWRLLTEPVFERDGWKCVRCKRYRPVQAHHILPKSRGGLDEPGNLVSLCAECHEYVQPRWKLFLQPYWQWVLIRAIEGNVQGERPA
jgi:5-methylcytosine-specific restriction endonuclease McrA